MAVNIPVTEPVSYRRYFNSSIYDISTDDREERDKPKDSNSKVKNINEYTDEELETLLIAKKLKCLFYSALDNSKKRIKENEDIINEGGVVWNKLVGPAMGFFNNFAHIEFQYLERAYDFYMINMNKHLSKILDNKLLQGLAKGASFAPYVVGGLMFIPRKIIDDILFHSSISKDTAKLEIEALKRENKLLVDNLKIEYLHKFEMLYLTKKRDKKVSENIQKRLEDVFLIVRDDQANEAYYKKFLQDGLLIPNSQLKINGTINLDQDQFFSTFHKKTKIVLNRIQTLLMFNSRIPETIELPKKSIFYIYGSTGIGKTHGIKRLITDLGLQFNEKKVISERDLSQENYEGEDSKGQHPGFIACTLMKKSEQGNTYLNTPLLLDDFDSIFLSGSDIALRFLKTFTDPKATKVTNRYFDIELDISRMPIILTGNKPLFSETDSADIAALRSRVQCFKFEAPASEQIDNILLSKVAEATIIMKSIFFAAKESENRKVRRLFYWKMVEFAKYILKHNHISHEGDIRALLEIIKVICAETLIFNKEKKEGLLIDYLKEAILFSDDAKPKEVVMKNVVNINDIDEKEKSAAKPKAASKASGKPSTTKTTKKPAVAAKSAGPTVAKPAEQEGAAAIAISTDKLQLKLRLVP